MDGWGTWGGFHNLAKAEENLQVLSLFFSVGGGAFFFMFAELMNLLVSQE